MERFFDELIPRQLTRDHVVGAVVVVVKNGAVFFQKGYGYADLAQQAPIDPDVTLFRIGSITKTFTWTAVMQLVEQGKLDLDADVNTYLDFTIPATFPQPITLRHLMAHAAGFEDRNFDTLAGTGGGPLGDWLKTHLPARVWPPGEVSAYSNYGAALAGYIVERVAGLSYEDYIARNLLQPLGMVRTTVLQPPPAALAQDMALDYVFAGGQFIAQPFEHLRAAPAGALSATAADMAAWMIAHLGEGQYGGSHILQAATAEQMRGLLFTHDPRLPGGWRYGFMDYSQNGENIYGHGGWLSAGLRSDMELFPEHELGLFIAYNGDTSGRAVGETPRAFINRYFPTAAAPVPAVAPFQGDTPQVAGAYHVARNAYTTIEKLVWLLDETPWRLRVTPDGKVAVRFGAETATYVQVEPLLFRQTDNDNLPQAISFRPDARGQIRYLFLGGRFARVRFAWYEEPNLHLALLGLGGVLALSTLLAAAVSALRRRRPSAAPITRAAQVVRTLLRAAALPAVLSLLFMVLAFSRRSAFTYGEVGFVAAGLFCSTVIVILTPVVLVGAVLAWRGRFWGLAERMHYTLTAAGLIGLSFFFIVWNLVGWRV